MSVDYRALKRWDRIKDIATYNKLYVKRELSLDSAVLWILIYPDATLIGQPIARLEGFSQAEGFFVGWRKRGQWEETDDD